MSARPDRAGRAAFRVFRPMPTRWHDNDVYGHVNNVVYYGWFDTAVNAWLIEQALLDPARDASVGLVVETSCTYFESVSFPEEVELGLAVERLGRSSVTYRIGVFRAGGALAAAQGRFTHVYVDRSSQTPIAIPGKARMAMEAILV